MNNQKKIAVQVELERRRQMFQCLIDSGQGSEKLVLPELTEKERIYRGGRGIYRDLEKTKSLDCDGVTVSIYYNPGRYNDDKDGGKYHYPVGKSERTKKTDQGDIQATKNSHKLGLPIFVISKVGNLRKVEVGFIDGWNDEKQFFKFSIKNEWFSGRL